MTTARSLRTDIGRLLLIASIPVILALQACDAPAYSRFYEIEGGLDPSMVLEFQPWPDDSAEARNSRYDLMLSIRNDANFPDRTLWLEMESTNDDGTLSTDTLRITLADAKGDFTGKRSYVLYQTDTVICRGIRLHEGMHIAISQCSRDEQLPGIRNIGLTLRKSQRFNQNNHE